MFGSSDQVLNQIVARDVGLVADRDEARDTDVEPARVVENRETQGAALRRHRDTTRGRIGRGERRVQRICRIGVQQAHAVGTDEPAAGAPNLREQCGFPLAALGSGFPEARADDADAPHALRQAVVHGSEHLSGRDRDDREIDRFGNVGDARPGAQAFDLGRRRMHGHDSASEAARDQVVQNLGADLPAGAVRTDDRHASRLEERFHRGRRRVLRALGRLLDEARGGLEPQRDMNDTTLEACRHGVPAVEEHVHHAPILGEHRRVESPNALPPRDLRQLFEHPRADTPALQRIADRKRHLGAARCRARPVEAGKRHDPSRDLSNERHRFRCVRRQEVPCPSRIEQGETEEPLIAALRRQLIEERQEPGDVTLSSRTQRQRRPVAKDDVSDGRLGDRGGLAVVRHGGSVIVFAMAANGSKRLEQAGCRERCGKHPPIRGLQTLPLEPAAENLRVSAERCGLFPAGPRRKNSLHAASLVDFMT